MLAKKWQALLAPVVSNTLCLNSAVEPLDVSVVVWSVESAVSGLDIYFRHLLLKVTPVLWAVVVNHGRAESQRPAVLLARQLGNYAW